MRIKPLFAWLPLITFFASAVLLLAANRLALPRLAPVGWLVLGLTGVLVGAQLIVTRDAFFLPSTQHAPRPPAEHYTGLPAVLWGVFFGLAGLAAMAASAFALVAPEQARTVFEQALDTPQGWGLLFCVLGVFLGLYGLIRVLAGGAARGRSASLRLRDLGYRAVGVLSLLLGGALAAVGVLLILAPDVFMTAVLRLLRIP